MLRKVFDEEAAAAFSTWARTVSRAARLRLCLFQVKGHKQDSVVTWTIYFVWKGNKHDKGNANVKRLGVFLLPPGWDAEGLSPSIKFAGTHLYTWVERGAVRVKFRAQEHNTVSPIRARTPNVRSRRECLSLFYLRGICCWFVLTKKMAISVPGFKLASIPCLN